MYEQITEQTRNESFKLTNRSVRYNQILEVLDDYKELSARQIAEILGYRDLNAVKPRITELQQNKIIEVSGVIKDDVTNRTVAMYRKVVNYV